MMAHIHTWRDRLGSLLEAAANRKSSSRYSSFDEENEKIFQQNQDRPWEKIQQDGALAFQGLQKALDSMPDEYLEDLIEEAAGRPIWREVGFSGYYHVLDHLSRYYLEHNDLEEAQDLQLRLAENMVSLDSSDEWKGTISYNLACFYAIAGQAEQAIAELSIALKGNQGLVDWSKKDTDLDSLRELPEYRALYRKM